jgi:hypothetical protein
MLVRILGLAAIVLGGLLWSTGHQPYLGPHIGLGFCVALLVMVLSVLAMTKRAVVPGAIGFLLALVLPVLGFMQLPLASHPMGMIQVAHLAVALTVVGIAERLYSAVRQG